MKKLILLAVCFTGLVAFSNAQNNNTPEQTNTAPAVQQAARAQITIEELQKWETKLKEGEKIKLHPVRLEHFTPEAKEYVLKNPEKYEIMQVEK